MVVGNHHIRIVQVLAEASVLLDDIGILVVRIVLVASVDNLDDGIHVVDSFLGQAFLVVADKDPDHLQKFEKVF